MKDLWNYFVTFVAGLFDAGVCSLLHPLLIIRYINKMQPFAAFLRREKCSYLQPYFSASKIDSLKFDK